MVRKGNRRKTLPDRNTVIEKLKKAIDNIAVPVDRVYLYGSHVNGRPTPYSDVDVAVVSPAFGKNVVAEAVMLMEAFEDTGLMVEPWPYSRQELEEAGPGDFLYEEIIKKGIRIA